MSKTIAEQQRDAAEKEPIVEKVSLRDALGRKRQLDAQRLDEGVRLPAEPYQPAAIGVANPGMGVPADMLAAAGGLSVAPKVQPNGKYQSATIGQPPMATPLTLIDQARAVAEALDRFSRSLAGAADWCEARAADLPPLEAQALRHAATVLRADAEKAKASGQP